MQRTPNLNLPQFEPTDKYSLEDYNEAYMTLDEKIKEAQDLIATWTQFKNNGGEIGGDVELKDDGAFRSFVSKRDGNVARFGVTSNGSTLLQNVKNDGTETNYYINDFGVSAQKDGTQSLGTSSIRWKDAWIGTWSKTNNGYTKLPNGIVMQWGQSNVTIGAVNTPTTANINLPIAFPSACMFANGNATTGEPAKLIGNVGNFTTTQLELRAINLINTNSVTIRWLAIGY